MEQLTSACVVKLGRTASSVSDTNTVQVLYPIRGQVNNCHSVSEHCHTHRVSRRADWTEC